MFEASEWLLFVVASLALVAVPGPAVLFIVARSVDGGRRSGLVTAAGIGLGNLTHALAAAFGVSAVIASTDWALVAVRFLGAAYLVYLGLRGLFTKREVRNGGELGKQPGSRRSDFWKGVLVALLNPKVILFLLAFLPQFVSAEKGDVWAQMLVLGVSFVGIGWLGDSAWALLSEAVFAKLRRVGKSKLPGHLAAFIYIFLGITMALAGLF